MNKYIQLTENERYDSDIENEGTSVSVIEVWRKSDDD
jgi:hypothetical protein